MERQLRRRLPTPQIQAFVVCREIWNNQRTGEFMLEGPVSHIPIPQFPANIKISVYAHMTGGHGEYSFLFELRAPDGDVVWDWHLPKRVSHDNPLQAHQLAFHDLIIAAPLPGRYDFALLADGEQIAHQPLLIGAPNLLK